MDRIIINAYPRRHSGRGDGVTLMTTMSRTENGWNKLQWRKKPEPRWPELTVVLNRVTNERGQRASNHRAMRKNARGVWLSWASTINERPCNRNYKLIKKRFNGSA
jgi:hypothetical protein